MKGKEEQLNDLLMRVATGCRVEEVTEEYAEVDGQMRLTKRKEIRRDIPPDLKAVQMLLSSGGTDVGQMSDAQLEEEKARLLGLLQKQSEKTPRTVNKKGGKQC
ncbi:MAG: hypothetical protein IJX18_00805 [Clostridia bacterium]|nr:hypothetical protein [Clostridia bacterium]